LTNKDLGVRFWKDDIASSLENESFHHRHTGGEIWDGVTVSDIAAI
jgi:hypothetical protein